MERPYRLSARFVATVQQPGRYGDGRGSGGLSLLVKHTARGQLAKSWARRISVDVLLLGQPMRRAKRKAGYLTAGNRRKGRSNNLPNTEGEQPL